MEVLPVEVDLGCPRVPVQDAQTTIICYKNVQREATRECLDWSVQLQGLPCWERSQDYSSPSIIYALLHPTATRGPGRPRAGLGGRPQSSSSWAGTAAAPLPKTSGVQIP